jgi:hypothetical protein
MQIVFLTKLKILETRDTVYYEETGMPSRGGQGSFIFLPEA